MKIKFEPRDLWVGVYWDRAGRVTTLETDQQYYRIYVCVIPCFPIEFEVRRKIPTHRRHENW